MSSSLFSSTMWCVSRYPKASRYKHYVLKLTSKQEINRIKNEDRRQYKQIGFLSKAKEQLVGLVLHTKAYPPSLSIWLSLYDLYILYPSLTSARCLSTSPFLFTPHSVFTVSSLLFNPPSDHLAMRACIYGCLLLYLGNRSFFHESALFSVCSLQEPS